MAWDEDSEEVMDAKWGPKLYRKSDMKTAVIESAILGAVVGGVIMVGLVNWNHEKFCWSYSHSQFNPDRDF